MARLSCSIEAELVRGVPLARMLANHGELLNPPDANGARIPNCRIRRVDRDGFISTVVGTGQGGYGGDGGPAAAARIGESNGLAVVSGGPLLVADTYNCRVRRVW